MRSVRMLAAVGAIVALLGGVACDDGRFPWEQDTQPVLGWFVIPNQLDAVGIQFSGCDGEPPMVVRETDTTVEITIADGGGCEPLHRLRIPLDAPLGNRVVIDGSTGAEVQRTADDDIGDP